MNLMLIEIIGTIAMLLAFGGVFLNNHLNRKCFYLWFVSNAISALLHVNIGIWSLYARDVGFYVLAIYGLWNWRRKQKVDHAGT